MYGNRTQNDKMQGYHECPVFIYNIINFLHNFLYIDTYTKYQK